VVPVAPELSKMDTSVYVPSSPLRMKEKFFGFKHPVCATAAEKRRSGLRSAK
jgi:hypothetical protein